MLLVLVFTVLVMMMVMVPLLTTTMMVMMMVVVPLLNTTMMTMMIGGLMMLDDRCWFAVCVQGLLSFILNPYWLTTKWKQMKNRDLRYNINRSKTQ